MITRQVVDAHHHLWDYDTPYGRYELADLQADVDRGHNIVQTVFVDCGSNYFQSGPKHLRPVGETVFVANCADRSAQTGGVEIAAIVGRADLRLGASVRTVLQHHIEAGGGRFRGIRHIGAHDPTGTVDDKALQRPLGLYRQENFQQGAAVLAEMGLTFDAWQYYFQLDDLVDLATNVADLTIIINHLGGPIGVGPYAERLDEVEAETRAGLDRLAERPNTVLKLGGVGMTRYGTGWEDRDSPVTPGEIADRWGPLISWSIDRFGPDRCMFESNFPVDAATVTYDALWSGFDQIAAAYTEQEQDDLFAGTARRVYGLTEP